MPANAYSKVVEPAKHGQALRVQELQVGRRVGSDPEEQRASLPRPFIPQFRTYVTNRHEVREVPIAVEPDSLSSGFPWQSRHNELIALVSCFGFLALSEVGAGAAADSWPRRSFGSF